MNRYKLLLSHQSRKTPYSYSLWPKKQTPLELNIECAVIRRFGVRGDTIAHPDANWKDFLSQVSLLNDKEPKVWNPLTQVPSPWIDMKSLAEAYGP